MADTAIPYFKNDAGIAKIKVKTREFMCVGASPPLDHPHIYIDMGHESETICPYCSTVFIYDPTLNSSCDPQSCAFLNDVEAA